MGTTLEILAPYLPYGIEVSNLDWKGSCKVLRGLDRPAAILVEDAGAIHVERCLPILRPFSALCDPLPNGTVPAKEVLLLIDKPRWAGLFQSYVKRLFVDEREQLMMEVDGAAYQIPTYNKLACLKSHLWGEDMRATVADYLRRNHFAVGLEPSQFIEKAAAGAPSIQEGASC